MSKNNKDVLLIGQVKDVTIVLNDKEYNEDYDFGRINLQTSEFRAGRGKFQIEFTVYPDDLHNNNGMYYDLTLYKQRENEKIFDIVGQFNTLLNYTDLSDEYIEDRDLLTSDVCGLIFTKLKYEVLDDLDTLNEKTIYGKMLHLNNEIMENVVRMETYSNALGYNDIKVNFASNFIKVDDKNIDFNELCKLSTEMNNKKLIGDVNLVNEYKIITNLDNKLSEIGYFVKEDILGISNLQEDMYFTNDNVVIKPHNANDYGEMRMQVDTTLTYNSLENTKQSFSNIIDNLVCEKHLDNIKSKIDINNEKEKSKDFETLNINI